MVKVQVVTCVRHASGIRPQSATSPAKRHRTTQLTLRAATTSSSVRNQTCSGPKSCDIRGWINIASRSSCNDVSHTEMNQTIRCPETLTSLHKLSRLHARVTNQATDCHHDLGTETRWRVWVNRHELLVDDFAGKRDSSCHGGNDRTTHRLPKINCSTTRAIDAGRFNVGKRHRGIDRWHQTTRSHEKGTKNHQTA